MSIKMSHPAVGDLGQIAVDLSHWQHDEGTLQLHPGDLGWHSLAGAAKTAMDLRVWSRDGQMVALGMMDGPGLLRMAMDPAAHDDDELARRISSDMNDPDAGVLVAGEATIEARGARSLRRLLSDEGWTADALWTPFRRDLSDATGRDLIERTAAVRIETIGLDQVDAWVTVHWSAFKGTPFEEADKRRLSNRWATMAGGPFSHLAQHLIAFDTEGLAVAVTTVWSAGDDRPGLIEPMGVHRDHRGRGYGGAITIAGADALKDLGSSSVMVGAENSNKGALATYAAAGFTALEPVADLKRPA